MGDKRVTLELENIAQKENIVIVYPDGYKRYWNECRKTAPTPPNLENINEEAFFTYMIDYFIKNHNIDKNKVYVIGTSGGGHMAYKLAITLPEKIKGICALIANLPDIDNMDCVEKKVEKPVMIINGTDDTVNPYYGGMVEAGGIKLGKVRSSEESFKYWATLAGYTTPPLYEKIPDLVADNKTIEKYTHKKKKKPEITLYKVNGGKHDYPSDINVYSEAWKFFKRI
jgi:polyhydroxybutyrate depolymerase